MTDQKLMRHGVSGYGNYPFNMPPKFIDLYERIMYGKNITDKMWCIEYPVRRRQALFVKIVNPPSTN